MRRGGMDDVAWRSRLGALLWTENEYFAVEKHEQENAIKPTYGGFAPAPPAGAPLGLNGLATPPHPMGEQSSPKPPLTKPINYYFSKKTV